MPLLPPRAPQLIPALPQPRSPRPARPPAANPAAPRAVAEGAGSPGSRWTEGGGDWGIGRGDMEPVTASALEEPALPIPGASTLVQGGGCQPRSAPVRGQSARVTGASRVSVPMQDGEQRQQTEKTPASGAPREPLSQVNAPGPAPRLGCGSGIWVSGAWGLREPRGPPDQLQRLRVQHCPSGDRMCVLPPGAAPCVHG